jgi:hypothetical protein
VLPVLGVGAGRGTAGHAAAKLIESAAVPAVALDPEEWWHTHRFAHRQQDPVVALDAPQQHDIMQRWIDRIIRAGFPLILITHRDTPSVAGTTCVVTFALPDLGDTAAATQPLAEHVFAGPLAAQIAGQLGRTPFAAR